MLLLINSPLSWLQVGSMLINRVANTDMTWHQEVTNAAPRVSPVVDLTLDDSHVIRAIDNLNFVQMKRELTWNVKTISFLFVPPQILSVFIFSFIEFVFESCLELSFPFRVMRIYLLSDNYVQIHEYSKMFYVFIGFFLSPF